MPNNLDITKLPKFKYGTTARINSTAVSNGSVLIDIEKGLAYADLANSRISLGDVVRVSSASSLPTTAYNKLYLTEDTGDLYYKVDNTWRMLSASANINDRLAEIDAAIEALQEASGTVAAHSHAISDVTGLATQLAEKAPDNASVEYIADTRSAGGAAWTGVTKDAALYDGKTIIFRLAYASASNATLNLTLADGSTTGAKNLYFSDSTRIGTQFVATNPVMLTYVLASDAWYVVNKYSDSNTAPTYLGGSYCGLAGTANASIATGGTLVNTAIGCDINTGNWYMLQSGLVLDWNKPLLFARSAYNAGAEIANADIVNLTTASARTLPGMSSSFAGFTKYANVYLVGTYDSTNSTVTLGSTFITSTIPSTEDGKVYIPLGWASSTYQYRFVPEHVLYKYYNGKFRKLDESAAGDMQKSVYDTDNDGVVDHAAVADSVAWDGVTNKPSSFTPAAHSHAISDITSLSTTLDNKITNPSGGSVGNVLKKTSTGVEWGEVSTSSGSIIECSSPADAISSVSQVNNGKLIYYTGTTNTDWTYGHLYLVQEQTSSGSGSYVAVDLMSGSASSINPKLMLVKPVSESNIYLVLQKSSTKNGTYTTVLDTLNNASDYQKLNVFDAYSGTFVSVTNGGIPPYYDNRPVLVDVENLLDLGTYYRYQWITSSSTVNNTDWYGGYYPTNNEQIHNLADRVQNIESTLNSLGITSIQLVNSLPDNPVSTVLYLIPDANS